MTVVFNTFQARLTVFFGALFVAVQTIAFFAIRDAIIDSIIERGKLQLVRALDSFNLEVDDRANVLRGWASILAADFGFRQAIASDDSLTIRSAVNNLSARMNADRIILVGLDNAILNDTGSAADAPRGDIVTLGDHGLALRYPDLIEAAADSQTAARFILMDQRLYHAVVTPILAPVPIAWILVASEVQNTYAANFVSHNGAQVELTFAAETTTNAWTTPATTLLGARPAELAKALPFISPGRSEPETVSLGNETFATVATSLPGSDSGPKIVAVLQFSIGGALSTFSHRLNLLIVVAFGFLAATLFGAAMIARGLARPIRELDQAAHRIAAGDYAVRVRADTQDEIGRLSATFNAMVDGIAERELRIEHQALHDVITSLPNRTAFERRLAQSIAAAGQSGGRLSVYLVQIGRFGAINYTLGHDVSDGLMREVGAILRGIVKKDDMVARHSTNMFAMLLPGAGIATVDPIVQRILERIEDPIGVAGHAIDVTAWIGEACFPEHGADAKTLLQRADTAIYEAKRNTRRFAVYDPAQDPHKPEQLTMMGELRSGIDRGEFKLFYQPKIDLKTDRIIAAEALIRWFHPKRGPVSPDGFIPLAEQTGNIHKLTTWVLGAAIAQAAAWRAKGLSIKVAINLSARDLGHRLLDDIRNLLATHAVPLSALIIELTESAFMADPAQAIEILNAISAMGISLAIDDYGMGYSSMSYLRRLPVKELKIDKSFVLKLSSSPGDQIIVRSTIDLGHNLGLSVTAEGIEDSAALDMLKSLGCETGQGYFIAKPLAAADFERFVAESRWGAAGP